jgi:hypothetical protein
VNVTSSLRFWLRKPFRTALDSNHRPAAGRVGSFCCLGRHGPASALINLLRAIKPESTFGRRPQATFNRGAATPASGVCVWKDRCPGSRSFIQLKLDLIITSVAAPLVTPLDQQFGCKLRCDFTKNGNCALPCCVEGLAPSSDEEATHQYRLLPEVESASRRSDARRGEWPAMFRFPGPAGRTCLRAWGETRRHRPLPDLERTIRAQAE